MIVARELQRWLLAGKSRATINFTEEGGGGLEKPGSFAVDDCRDFTDMMLQSNPNNGFY